MRERVMPRFCITQVRPGARSSAHVKCCSAASQSGFFKACRPFRKTALVMSRGSWVMTGLWDGAPCAPDAIVGGMQTLAVIDFETTGISPGQGARATEVAIVLVQGGCIVDRYQSLMNAGVS